MAWYLLFWMDTINRYSSDLDAKLSLCSRVVSYLVRPSFIRPSLRLKAPYSLFCSTSSHCGIHSVDPQDHQTCSGEFTSYWERITVWTGWETKESFSEAEHCRRSLLLWSQHVLLLSFHVSKEVKHKKAKSNVAKWWIHHSSYNWTLSSLSWDSTPLTEELLYFKTRCVRID